MDAKEKFLFDTSFESESMTRAAKARAAEEAAAEEPPAPTFSEEELAAAKAAAFAEGKTAGEAAAEKSIAQRTVEQLSKLAAQFESTSAALEEKVHQSHQETVLAAMTVVRKLFPQMNSDNGLTEIKAVVEDCLERLRDEPRLVVRVADQEMDSLKAQLDACIKRSGFGGKLVFLADDRLEPGDVRVEWADGGAERSQAALWQEIDGIIERTLGAALEVGLRTSAEPAKTGNSESGPMASADIEPLRRAQTA